MILRLAPVLVPVMGIYTISGNKNRLPPRMLFLEPEAAASMEQVAKSVIISDMFRSPESSLAAVREGRGAKMPGYSGHNFGLSIDLDVPGSIKRGGFADKRQLDVWLRGIGWFCHRKDHLITPLAGESHHFNFFGPGFVSKASSPAALEAKIVSMYGKDFNLTAKQMQAALAKLHFYSGMVDGKVGPLTKEAIRVFQRAWGQRETGSLDARGMRTLAYVAAERP